MSADDQSTEQSSVRKWQPVSAIERRVLGVLVEKAKTTPESYPLSLNAIRTGSNQKNNRAPLMQLEEDQVDEALEKLRKLGAIAQIQGGGRVDKYRHLAYEWLGVEKVELAVMAELLLRGAQTVGELRGRAARMEPIKDLTDLQPTLDSLGTKKLIIYLTPPGRGSIVTHTLYLDHEMEKVRREAGTSTLGTETLTKTPTSPRSTAELGRERHLHTAPSQGDDSLADELARLREELAAVKQDLVAVQQHFESTAQELRQSLDDLHRQLGN